HTIRDALGNMMRMKIGTKLARREQPQLGISGVARVSRRTRELLRRVSAGDIVVLDNVDLDRATADSLVRSEVAGVVNASPSISGRYPNLGPEILVGAGIAVVDNVGSGVLRDGKDGSKARLHANTVDRS